MTDFEAIIATVHVKAGRMSSRALKHFLATAKEGVYYFNISQKASKRSDAQNRFYWGACVPLVVDATGYTKNEVHAITKEKLLFIEEQVKPLPDGSTIKVRVYRNNGETKHMTVSEFSEFIMGFEELWQVTLPTPIEYGL